MRKVSFWMVLLAVLAVSSVVFAQRGGGPGGGGPGGGPGGGGPGGMMMGGGMMGGGGGGLGMFIRSPEMREAIGLNDDQVKQLEEVMQAARPNFPQRQPGGAPPSADEMAKMRDEMTKMQADFMAKAEKIVTPEQMGKAKTLAFQSMGGLEGNAPPQGGPGGPGGGPGGPRMSALDSEFAMGALNLTADQKKALKAAQDKLQETRRAMFSGGNRPSQEERDNMRVKIEDATKAMKTEIESLLTDDQKTLAKKLVDETPEFVRQSQQRRQQGGQGGPGGGPDGQPRSNYRPGSESWQPGQGGGQRQGGRQGGGGGFPTGG